MKLDPIHVSAHECRLRYATGHPKRGCVMRWGDDPRVYAVVDHWIEVALRRHSSLFSFEGVPICRVYGSPSPMPVFLTGKQGKQFYIRSGNGNRPLDPEATHDSIEMHWRD
jgi:hypothetical protein